MAIDFLDIISDLEGSGFYEVVLPFLLIFAVIFAILENVKIFGRDSKKINGVVALVAGFLMIRNDMLIEFMNDILARFSVILIVVLAFLIIFGIFGSKVENWGKGFFAFFVIVALLAGVFVLVERMGYYDITGTMDVDDFLDEYGNTVWIAIFLLVILGIIFWGSGDTNKGTGKLFDLAGTQLGHSNRGSG